MIAGAGEARLGLDMHSVPLSVLSNHAKEPLFLLNGEKVLPSPDGLPRDWRGLASLACIPGELYFSIRDCSDPGGPTAKLISQWVKRNDGTATVGRLQECLQALDRWDIYDDTKSLFEEEAERYLRRPAEVGTVAVGQGAAVRDERITFDDVQLFPKLQLYNAYVLYAKEDRNFAHELIDRLKTLGFKICSKEDVLAGFSTQLEPVSKLISERCHHIIVIYSPDFLQSPDNEFYMTYAQALGIERRTRKVVPCMYRQCTLPPSCAFYTNLHYSEGSSHPTYNFWHRLAVSLTVDADTPRLQTDEAVYLPAPAPIIASAELMASAPQSSKPSADSQPANSERLDSQRTTRPPESQDKGPTKSQDRVPAEPEKNRDSITISTVDISELKINTKKPNLLQKFLRKKSKNKKEKKQLVEMLAS